MENHDYYLWVGDVCSFFGVGCLFPSGWLSVTAGLGLVGSGTSSLDSCLGSRVLGRILPSQLCQAWTGEFSKFWFWSLTEESHRHRVAGIDL